ncbi:PID and SH2 domain containing protein [Trichuris trichiura]|uniref:PID and SH2 domain containing protein n=1 Tax=Trichuris trichiura TaxID=36087 RepID=A0A077Z5V6_TRITR|nr:PID and SH2 domain containing protein [Trichuris trichiura]
MDGTTNALHSNAATAELSYDLRYIGCVGVATSMKQLDFTIRSTLAKECISKVCIAANMISANKAKRGDKKLSSFIAGDANLRFGGQNVRLFISTAHLRVVSLESDQQLFCHTMPDISFASGGDQSTTDFIAYIAKTAEHGRQCYVFECALGTEKEILSAIGQAFALRFEHATRCSPAIMDEYISRSPQSSLHVGRSRLMGVSEVPLTNKQTIPSSNAYHDQATSNLATLKNEPWFHGKISREESQRLVCNDGDFLVRQSLTDPGQFVLTGMQQGKYRHLLLIDDDGHVRTKDQRFDNVTHLINYHRTHRLPITSLESALLLRNAVPRLHKL